MARKAIEKKARIRYEKTDDTWRVEIWDNEYNEWGFCMSAACFNSYVNAALVSDNILEKICELARMGFEIVA